MARPRKREERHGPRLLKVFLKKNKITYRLAAKALQVMHPTVLNWVSERTVPLPHLRKRISVWTKDEVPERSWDLPSEQVAIEPFQASGTDE